MKSISADGWEVLTNGPRVSYQSTPVALQGDLDTRVPGTYQFRAVLMGPGNRVISISNVVTAKFTAQNTLMGTWNLGSGCNYAGGGKLPNKMHNLSGQVQINSGNTGRFSGVDMGGNVESGSLVGAVATLSLHPTYYSEDGASFNNSFGWSSRLQLQGNLSPDRQKITGSVTHGSAKPDCTFTMNRIVISR
jgi:hypothetical protein